MNGRCPKILVLLLALALVPGLAEVVENVGHLALAGHSAHAADTSSEDQETHDSHEPEGPEHGCTPTFHFCGCHANLVFVDTAALPSLHLRHAGSSGEGGSPSRTAGFRPSVERPPQA